MNSVENEDVGLLLKNLKIQYAIGSTLNKCNFIHIKKKYELTTGD